MEEDPMPVTRQLSIVCNQRDDVLLRIVSLCRRRQCQIVALRYERGGPREPGHLSLSVVAGDYAARTLASWLLNLIDVRHVEASCARPEARTGDGSRPYTWP